MILVQRALWAFDVTRYSALVGARDFKSIWTWKSWLFGWGTRTITSAYAWLLVGELIGSDETTEYLAIGQVFVVAISSTCWTIAAASWDRLDGTYEVITLTPANYFFIIVGRTAVWAANGIASSVFAAAVIFSIFRWQAPWTAYLLLLASLTASCCSIFIFAVAHGVFCARWPQLRNFILGIVVIELTLFSGSVVPQSHWPEVIQIATNFIPVTNSLSALRHYADTAPLDILKGIASEFLVAALWLGLAMTICRSAITKQKLS
jgi:ABC-2 type transport system permease protein